MTSIHQFDLQNMLTYVGMNALRNMILNSCCICVLFFSYSLISSNYLVVRNSKSNSYYLIVAQIFRHSLDGGIVLSDIKNVKVEKFEIYFVEK